MKNPESVRGTFTGMVQKFSVHAICQRYLWEMFDILANDDEWEEKMRSIFSDLILIVKGTVQSEEIAKCTPDIVRAIHCAGGNRLESMIDMLPGLFCRRENERDRFLALYDTGLVIGLINSVLDPVRRLEIPISFIEAEKILDFLLYCLKNRFFKDSPVSTKESSEISSGIKSLRRVIKKNLSPSQDCCVSRKFTAQLFQLVGEKGHFFGPNIDNLEYRISSEITYGVISSCPVEERIRMLQNHFSPNDLSPTASKA